jgi:hypothetical protein
MEKQESDPMVPDPIAIGLPPEADHKPPFGAWWKMYAFVLAFMGLLILGFALLANMYAE